MIVVKTQTVAEYYFADEAEEKIKNHVKEFSCTLEDAIYDLIDQGELDLRYDNVNENVAEPEIIRAEEYKKFCKNAWQTQTYMI